MKRDAENRPPFTTVLFDMDDTLLDSFKAREDTIRQVFRASGIGLAEDWDLADLRGYEIRDIFQRSGAPADRLDEFYTEYRRAYWTQAHTPVVLYPGVRELLQSLSRRGLKLGVVTQKGREFLFEGCRAGATVELEKTGILQHFHVIVGFEDVVKTKPDPEGIRFALERLQSTTNETIYVGDSLADMLAAHNAGCRSCHACWGVTALREFTPDYTASTPEELRKIICY